ncbi:transcription factor-like protein DPA [Phalaenopsis equestris]|uniref:transcription factor-like protein DPA n=1 Tax=Phalaenopsis equestris TaxID=78828 RepID=UPI0009E248F0|nr:transcription factor-like protein DPA [Phalaenopsis equestris]
MENDLSVALRCGINEGISQRNQMCSLGENGGAMTPPPCGSLLRLSNACTQEDGNFLAAENADKNKKVSRIIGWGLRRFSKIVCQKVQVKGRTTYNEVADEIISDLATLNKTSEFEFDEKNIRRRVYDAFNVLLAINVIAKDKKEIHWIGFPNTSTKTLEDLKRRHMNVTNRIQEKANYLRELEAKAFDIRKLIARNQRRHASGNVSSEGVTLPFLLVQTNPKATVEIEISQDMQLVHFDFNGSPFSLHDEAAILKMMRCPLSAAKNQFFRCPARALNSIRDYNGKPLKPASFSWNSENSDM